MHEWIETPERSLSEVEKTTWVFDADSFVPSAKLVGDKSYSIISDYLGTPCQAYSETGAKVWEYEQKSYGGVESLTGAINFVPFRYQGQYEDVETGLYYNRFRYYDPENDGYISQDPIGLLGGIRLYSYVNDSNRWIDPCGLTCNAPNGYRTGDVDPHGNLSPGSNRAAGHTNTRADGFVQSHHPIQDAWAQKNIKGYNRNSAPATLLKSESGSAHAKISAAQRSRRAAQGGWNTTLKQEFNTSYREMIDSGVSPKQAQKAIKDSYKYFDSLRGQNINNPFFDI